MPISATGASTSSRSSASTRRSRCKRDIATFTGKTGQYVFISSASVYEKPVRHYMMSEKTTKLENRYWEYSRNKIACEELLRAQDKLPYTIVRPSHTVRTGMPIQHFRFIEVDRWAATQSASCLR